MSKPTDNQVHTLANKMLSLKTVNYAYDINLWSTLTDFERLLVNNHVNGRYKDCHRAIIYGMTNLPIVFETIRSVRLSVYDTGMLLKCNNKEDILNYLAKRRGSKSVRACTKFWVSREIPALKLYREWKPVTVVKIVNGFNPLIPFLVVSPDSVGFDSNGRPTHSIEVKTINFDNLEDTFGLYLNCFVKDRWGWNLKKGNKIYHQIQMNLLVLNLPYCDLIVYNDKKERITTVIKVERDEVYLRLTLPKLFNIFLQLVVPFCTMKLKSIL